MSPQYEFKVTEIKMWFGSQPVSARMSKHLNEISEQGWELVNIVSSLGMLEFPNYVRFIWKKPKS